MKKQRFTTFDKLCDFLRENLPEHIVLMKNHPRYDEIQESIEQICKYVWDIDGASEVLVSRDELVGTTLYLEIVTDVLTVYETDRFCSALKAANNFEVVPLKNGKISFAVGFQDAYVPAPPHK